jgi:hypothetical protein
VVAAIRQELWPVLALQGWRFTQEVVVISKGTQLTLQRNYIL